MHEEKSEKISVACLSHASKRQKARTHPTDQTVHPGSSFVSFSLSNSGSSLDLIASSVAISGHFEPRRISRTREGAADRGSNVDLSTNERTNERARVRISKWKRRRRDVIKVLTRHPGLEVCLERYLSEKRERKGEKRDQSSRRRRRRERKRRNSQRYTQSPSHSVSPTPQTRTPACFCSKETR